jgi:hypothetical protein
MNNTSLPSKEEQEFDTFLGSVQLQQLQTSNPLQKLSKTLLYNILFGGAICIVYCVAIILVDTLVIKAILAALLVFSVWAVYSGYIIYRQFLPQVSVARPVLEEMEHHYATMTVWIKKQEITGLFFYPISAAGGFMMGGAAGSGKPIIEFMSNIYVLLMLLVLVAILEPICFYLVRYFNKLLFGVHLANLKRNIDLLKEGE